MLPRGAETFEQEVAILLMSDCGHRLEEVFDMKCAVRDAELDHRGVQSLRADDLDCS